MLQPAPAGVPGPAAGARVPARRGRPGGRHAKRTRVRLEGDVGAGRPHPVGPASSIIQGRPLQAVVPWAPVDTYRCGNDGCPSQPILDEDPTTPVERRQPCPVCGSRSRLFTISVGGALRTTGRANISVSGTASGAAGTALTSKSDFGVTRNTTPSVALSSTSGLSVGEPRTPTDSELLADTPSLSLAFVGLPVTHEIRVLYRDLSNEVDPYCIIEVTTASGSVLAAGGGATPADALSVMFERMLPPSSTEAYKPGDDEPVLDDE